MCTCTCSRACPMQHHAPSTAQGRTTLRTALHDACTTRAASARHSAYFRCYGVAANFGCVSRAVHTPNSAAHTPAVLLTSHHARPSMSVSALAAVAGRKFEATTLRWARQLGIAVHSQQASRDGGVDIAGSWPLRCGPRSMVLQCKFVQREASTLPVRHAREFMAVALSHARAAPHPPMVAVLCSNASPSMPCLQHLKVAATPAVFARLSPAGQLLAWYPNQLAAQALGAAVLPQARPEETVLHVRLQEPAALA